MNKIPFQTQKDIEKGSVKKLDCKQKLLVIIGPTAVGKTKLSIELAKRFDGEIISGDSMQVYKGMDIGTAKIKQEEMEGIAHHLIDIKDPSERFSVAEFQEMVRRKITEISSRGHLPMIVGGTGLYIQSVLYDYQFSEVPANATYRRMLEQKAKKLGNLALHRELAEIDPQSANSIHPNNIRRVIRALEVYYSTGKVMSEARQSQQPDLLYETALIGLTMEREQLYNRINARVDLMVAEGLLKEVSGLYEQGLRNCQSIQAIGYKEIYDYLDGKVSFDEAIENLKKNSRHYAKRQLTWFRNKMDVQWFKITDTSEFEKKIIRYVEGKLQIKSNTY